MKPETNTLDIELDIENLRLLHDEILLLKCYNDHARDDKNVLVYLPETVQDTTLWCEVVKIGPKCRYLKPDMLEAYRLYMHIPEYERKGWHKVGKNMFVIREKLVDDNKIGDFKPFVVVEER
jgi:hypothetical protein